MTEPSIHKGSNGSLWRPFFFFFYSRVYVRIWQPSFDWGASLLAVIAAFLASSQPICCWRLEHAVCYNRNTHGCKNKRYPQTRVHTNTYSLHSPKYTKHKHEHKCQKKYGPTHTHTHAYKHTRKQSVYDSFYIEMRSYFSVYRFLSFLSIRSVFLKLWSPDYWWLALIFD